MENPTDEEIIAKLSTARGRRAIKAAFEDLYDRYFQQLLRYGRSRKDRLTADDMKDLVQDTLIALMTQAKAGPLHLDQSLEKYLYGILNNKILNFLRSTRRARAREKLAVWLMRYSFNPSPEQEYISRETEAEIVALVNNTLGQLGETCRKIFRLMMEDHTYAEIADILDYRPGVVKVTVHRCKDNFRALVRA